LEEEKVNLKQPIFFILVKRRELTFFIALACVNYERYFI